MGKWKYGVSCAEETSMSAPLLLEGSLYACMEKASDFGYQGVEFHTRESLTIDLEKVKEIKESSNVSVCCIVTGRLYTQGKHGLLDDDKKSEQAAIDGMKLYVDMAHSVAADMIIGWAKGVVPEGADRKTYLNKLAKNLKIIDEYAAKKNVRVLLEVINHYETNIFNTAKETLDFIEAHQLSNCYIHLDTYHMSLEEFDFSEVIRLCGKKLGYLHVADNSRRYPGSGQIDFKCILNTLEEVDYDGWVTIECLPDPDRDTAARKAIQYLKVCENAKYGA